MAEQMNQALNTLNASQGHANLDPTAMSDYLTLVAGHSIKALIRDRGEPTTPEEHRALMQDASMLAQMTWMAVRTKD